MLDELILSKLNELTIERKELENEINQNIRKQNEYNDQINQLMEKEDVGMELFSPRTAATSTRQQVDEIRALIDELQFHEAKLRDKIESNHQNELKLKDMVDETQEKQPVIGEDELTVLLNRVENVINGLESDPMKTRSELENICYYIKALITRIK